MAVPQSDVRTAPAGTALVRFGNGSAPAPAPSPAPALVLSGVSATGQVGTPGAATVSNSGPGSANWSAGLNNGATVAPSSGTLASGASVNLALSYLAAATHLLTLVNGSGGTVSGGTGGNGTSAIVVTDAPAPAPAPSTPDIIRPPAVGLGTRRGSYGDSITEYVFKSQWYSWGYGLIGAPMEDVVNSGVSGRSIGDMAAQIDNDWQDAGGHPGLAGMPWMLDVLHIMGGTNGWRGNSPVSSVDSGTLAAMDTIIAKAKGYARCVVIHPIPPIVGGVSSPTYARDLINAAWRAKVLADTSGKVSYIDQTADMTDSSGGGLAVYFLGDDYHPNGAGALRQAQTAQPKMLALLANQSWLTTSPLVTDPADVYPTTAQYGTNATNAGSVAFSGGWSGNAPIDWTIDTYGSGIGGLVSIVASSDTNPVPWVRIKPNASVGGYAVIFGMPGAGAAITSSSPAGFELLLEVRCNNLSNYDRIEFALMNSAGNRFSATAYLQLDPSGKTARATIRNNFRTAGYAGGGTPRIYGLIWGAANASGEMGSIDLRCLSVRAIA